MDTTISRSTALDRWYTSLAARRHTAMRGKAKAAPVAVGLAGRS